MASDNAKRIAAKFFKDALGPGPESAEEDLVEAPAVPVVVRRSRNRGRGEYSPADRELYAPPVVVVPPREPEPLTWVQGKEDRSSGL